MDEIQTYANDEELIETITDSPQRTTVSEHRDTKSKDTEEQKNMQIFQIFRRL